MALTALVLALLEESAVAYLEGPAPDSSAPLGLLEKARAGLAPLGQWIEWVGIDAKPKPKPCVILVREYADGGKTYEVTCIVDRARPETGGGALNSESPSRANGGDRIYGAVFPGDRQGSGVKANGRRRRKDYEVTCIEDRARAEMRGDDLNSKSPPRASGAGRVEERR